MIIDEISDFSGQCQYFNLKNHQVFNLKRPSQKKFGNQFTLCLIVLKLQTIKLEQFSFDGLKCVYLERAKNENV